MARVSTPFAVIIILVHHLVVVRVLVEHICAHRISDCLKRSPGERTFERKDKLIQHVSKFHGCTLDPSVVDAWEAEPTRMTTEWDCGFCDERGMSWSARARHIAGHFREGKDMTMWKRT